MLRSIATVSLSGTLPEKLEAVASAGFDGVEIFEQDLLGFAGTPTEVRRMACDLGLQIFMLQPFRDFEGVSPERLKKNLLRAERKFELMHELGTCRLLVCSSVSPDTLRDDALIIDQLGRLALLAQQHDIVVGYEALAWGRHVNSYRHAWRLVQAVGSSNIGLVLDSFHTLAIGDKLDELAGIPGDRIAFVQIADAPRLAMDVLEWSRHFRCFPGQGELSLAEFVAPILAGRYAGPLSLEVFNDDFRASSASDTAKDGMRSLLFLEEAARARLLLSGPLGETSPVVGSITGEMLDLESSRGLPAPACQGIEFIEFAVDESGKQRLGELLSVIGFRWAGRHRSKNVALYRQGETNLVLNAEPNSFASSFFDTHGVSLCAVATRVADVGAAHERAVSYGYRPFLGRTGPNEQLIPGVRAPDGSLIYFVGDDGKNASSIYETDFILDGEAQPESELLERIDHISFAMQPDAMEASLLFYRTAFCFKADKPVTLPDPYGLVRSQVVHSDQHKVQIVLTSSRHGNTGVGRTLSAYRGAGLHHLALATHNIFRAAKALRDAGAPLLPIPQNYYFDLAARFDLGADFIAELSGMNVLYDRDDRGGELLHLYVGQVESRFFIEILQRRDGYQGFGATNAPIRHAAQIQTDWQHRANRSLVAAP